jgi:acetyl esterase
MLSGLPCSVPVKLLTSLLALSIVTGTAAAPAGTHPVRIMAVGDSITAGADFFSCYRYPLWEKLFAAGYVVEFVGTQQSESRIGPLAHEGYGGRNAAWLARTVPDHFREHPADIVLLHSGHNYSIEEEPVPLIVAATESLVTAFRETNPRVTVLLAQVIPAGKLPKYTYIPELNAALARLATRLDHPDQRVVIVDQATGFDWETDTVADKVHPNAAGAEKMAAAWFRELRKILPPATVAFAPQRLSYKQLSTGALDLHVFQPSASSPPAAARGRPAIVFFYAGGWTHGTPIQFYAECAHFAERGYVAISADYRTTATHGTTPFDAVEDAREALLWVRNHAAQLGVDPAHLVAAGASAGGHLAATVALTARDADARPAALLLWYPILDTGPGGYGHALFGERFTEASPLHLLANDPHALPPTLIMVGTQDPAVPEKTVRAFQSRAAAAGARCDVVLYPDADHPLYAYREGGGPLREATLKAAKHFLEQAIPQHSGP